MAKNDSIIDLELDPDLYFDEPPEEKGKKAPRGRKAPKKGKKRGHAAKARKKNKKKVSRKAWWAWPVTIVMLCALLGLGLAVVYEKYQYEDFTQMREVVARPGFCQGITIDGQDVTGRMLDDVLAQWRGEDQARRAGLDVTLVNDADTWVLNTETLAYDSDYESVIREAWTLGREGTPRERYQVIRDIQANGRAFTTTSGYDDGLLRGIVTQAAESLSTPAVEADVIDFDIETLQFTFSSEAIGTYVDADALYDQALQALSAGQGGQTIAIVQEPVMPTVTRQYLSENMGLMGEAQTDVAGSYERRNNVRMATEMLNGVCIMPGETFSFNGTVGKRTEERGFMMAPVYANGMSATEIGGGVCQVSTTLFNSVLYADLNVVSRSPHTRPASYVPIGLDATVSWDIPDFKFMNDTSYPVWLVTHYDADKRVCYTSIYGQKLPNGMYVGLEAITTEELEPGDPVYIPTHDLPRGETQRIESPVKGYKAEVYKIYYNADGTEMDRMLYIRSTYDAVGTKYLIGQ